MEITTEKQTVTPVVPVTLKPVAPTSTPEDGIRASINKLITFGYIEREVEPIPGLKLVMHSLTDAEKDQANTFAEKEEGIKEKMNNPFEGAESSKKPVLAFAVTQINGIAVDTIEKKKVWYDGLKQMQNVLVDLIFLEYQKIFIDQVELIQQGLKKN